MLTRTKFPSAPDNGQSYEYVEEAENIDPGNDVQIQKVFGKRGNKLGEFDSPHGFCTGVKEEIVVADTNNHRIQVKKHSVYGQCLDFSLFTNLGGLDNRDRDRPLCRD